MVGNTNTDIILSTTYTPRPGQARPGSGQFLFKYLTGCGKQLQRGMERANTFLTFNYKEGLKLTHKSHSLHRIIAGVTLTMKIATYLTGLVFLRTWIWTFLTTVWTPHISGLLPESRQMFF